MIPNWKIYPRSQGHSTVYLKNVVNDPAIVDTELDGAVGMNSGIFNNPFLIWGKYRKTLFKTTLKLSFQFHHTQMDGAHAGRFLERLQSNINGIMSNDK